MSPRTAKSRPTRRKPAPKGASRKPPVSKRKKPAPMPIPKPGQPPLGGLPSVMTAAQLAPLVNAYMLSAGPPRTITVPSASVLAALQDITVSGQLLNKQTVAYDLKTDKRTASGSGSYTKQEKDGDLHFCLGVKQGQPHIACELQNAAAWIPTFNAARGKPISVSGFFRCLFEHPGFKSNDDAHIFEIHPVRAVNISGSIQAFNVDKPVQTETHTWKVPYDLNQQDGRISVSYNKAKDTLTFSGMDGRDENYIDITGTISNIRLSSNPPNPSRCTFNSPDIGHSVEMIALHGTTAERQLMQFKGTSAKTTVLRNIDLGAALKNQYVINLLAIDVQAG